MIGGPKVNDKLHIGMYLSATYRMLQEPPSTIPCEVLLKSHIPPLSLKVAIVFGEEIRTFAKRDLALLYVCAISRLSTTSLEADCRRYSVPNCNFRKPVWVVFVLQCILPRREQL